MFQDKDNRAWEIMNEKFITREELEMYQSDLSSNNIESEFCEECSIIRRKKVYHCRRCRVCIEGLDHHCLAMGLCIGSKNLAAFISYLVLGFMTSIFSFVITGTGYFRLFYNAKFDQVPVPISIFVSMTCTWIFGVIMPIGF